MSKDIKKALEHCAEWKCDNCPNGDELGSGEIVCRGRLLPQVLEYISDLEQQLALTEKALELACDDFDQIVIFDTEFYKSDNWYNYFIKKAEKELKSE